MDAPGLQNSQSHANSTAMDIRRAHCPAIILWLALAGSISRLEAANRFVLPAVTVCQGENEVGILLRADLDQPVLGFSFGIHYDPALLDASIVTLDGGIVPQPVDFFDGRIVHELGLIGYGCVFDFEAASQHALPAGTGQPIVQLKFNIVGESGGESPITLETVPSNPDPSRPVKNVLTSPSGDTIRPMLVSGTVRIADCSPHITTLSGNVGQAGRIFQVVGENFDKPGLEVSVCGASAAAELGDDGATLDVTAPDCPTLGFAPLRVCTSYGCDEAAEGYEYVERPPGGLQKPGDENQDGNLDLSDPVALLNHLFIGSNPTLPCGDGTAGDPANLTLLDANGDGGIDLSDAVSILSFLFLGGGEPVLCAGNPACPCVVIEGCFDSSACQ